MTRISSYVAFTLSSSACSTFFLAVVHQLRVSQRAVAAGGLYLVYLSVVQ